MLFCYLLGFTRLLSEIKCYFNVIRCYLNTKITEEC